MSFLDFEAQEEAVVITFKEKVEGNVRRISRHSCEEYSSVRFDALFIDQGVQEQEL